jgi:hypothetical protein
MRINHRHLKKPMTQKLSDPSSFLSSLVSKKGRSDLYGVYLTSVNVLADSSTDYGYNVPVSEIERDLRNVFSRDEHDWNRLLVDTRVNESEIVFPISFLRGMEPVTAYFVVEGNEMSCLVFIPTLVVEEFVTEVTFFQALLKKVAHFAGKTNTSIRFTIGAASMQWEDLVDQGHAREVDVGF